MTTISSLGRGFVRSGSGYVSTPATRAAARAAGTFGAEGYAGAEATATKLLTVLEQASRDYNAAIGKRSTEARATVAASWAIMEQEKAKARIAAAAAAREAEVHRGYGAAFAAAESVEYPSAEETAEIRAAARRDAAAAKTTPPTPPAECQKGLFYDAKWYLQCATGYIEYTLKGHNKCICSARMAEAKAQLDSLYAKEGANGDGDGDGIFAGFKNLGKIANYIPVLIIGVVVIAAIGMFKK